ncbi:hypothetical protein [Paraburkholderia youngii]|uniref:hypothetical protein n=1 Tax=Paraburkholderia youngii TaxID=2782701 RepID=UPI0015902DB5|nr:hypothetical protein [Paraburkholderia youngii]NUX59417.1 hypothetical protein [Paraburkholderia youngii]
MRKVMKSTLVRAAVVMMGLAQSRRLSLYVSQMGGTVGAVTSKGSLQLVRSRPLKYSRTEAACSAYAAPATKFFRLRNSNAALTFFTSLRPIFGSSRITRYAALIIKPPAAAGSHARHRISDNDSMTTGLMQFDGIVAAHLTGMPASPRNEILSPSKSISSPNFKFRVTSIPAKYRNDWRKACSKLRIQFDIL